MKIQPQYDHLSFSLSSTERRIEGEGWGHRAEPGRRPSRRERGMVTVIFIALLAIMMVLVMVESQALIRLHRQAKLLEQQQIKRLNGNGPQTNNVTTVSRP